MDQPAGAHWGTRILGLLALAAATHLIFTGLVLAVDRYRLNDLNGSMLGGVAVFLGLAVLLIRLAVWCWSQWALALSVLLGLHGAFFMLRQPPPNTSTDLQSQQLLDTVHVANTVELIGAGLLLAWVGYTRARGRAPRAGDG